MCKPGFQVQHLVSKPEYLRLRAPVAIVQKGCFLKDWVAKVGFLLLLLEKEEELFSLSLSQMMLLFDGQNCACVAANRDLSHPGLKTLQFSNLHCKYSFCLLGIAELLSDDSASKVFAYIDKHLLFFFMSLDSLTGI